MAAASLEIAKSLGLSESELMQHALKSLLQDKHRELLQARLAILDRYQVDTLSELEAQITDGRASEHPAWEDLITLENIDRRVADRNEIYRHDNAPHRRWQQIDTFPYHFYDGAETNVTASHISLEPTAAIRQFCAFARQKLRQESSQNKS